MSVSTVFCWAGRLLLVVCCVVVEGSVLNPSYPCPPITMCNESYSFLLPEIFLHWEDSAFLKCSTACVYCVSHRIMTDCRCWIELRTVFTPCIILYNISRRFKKSPMAIIITSLLLRQSVVKRTVKGHSKAISSVQKHFSSSHVGKILNCDTTKWDVNITWW